MKMKNIIPLLSCLVLFSSCVKDTLESEVYSDRVHLYANMPPVLKPISYPAVKGGPDSDSGVRNPDYNGSLNIALARVDQNYLEYPSFINCEPLPATMGAPVQNSDNIREITFRNAQFYDNDNEISFAAWYPWPADGTIGEGYGFESGPEQTVVTVPIDGQTDIMYSTVASGNRSQGFNMLYFNHALCVYRVHVYAMIYQDDEKGEVNTSQTWGKLESMSVVRMATSCRMTLPRAANGQDYEIVYEYEEGTDGQRGQVIDLSDPDNNIFFDPGESLPVGLSEKRHVATFIAAPPEDGILSINLSTSNADAEQKVSVARDFEAGYAYDIILRFSDHGVINADVSVSDWIDGGTVDQDADASIFYDLSTYGTSNCYHISSANYGYCFNGTVKGNGNTSLFGLSQQDVEISPAYVDILWHDMENCPVRLVSNTLVNGRVLLRVDGNEGSTVIPDNMEGNVLIAAYDRNPKKDENGNVTDKDARILWTWHLWLCDPVQEQGYSNGFIVQDRNLGAKDYIPSGSGENTWGLLYQWGRPTPFRNTKVGDIYNGNRVSMAEAISNPTVLYGGADESGGLWLDDPSLAGYLEYLWGYTDDHEDPVKTIYDPCPQGYRMYEERMWRGLKAAQESITDDYVKLHILLDDIYYPFQDTYLANGDFVEHGAGADDYNHGAFLWSGTIDLQQNNPYRLIYNSSGSLSVSYDNRRNSIMPVRCVAEYSQDVITDLSASQTANCYMVHREGYYKFKADTRGNGVGRLLPLGGTTMAEINAGMGVSISPKKVDFLWWQGDFTEVDQVDPALGSSLDTDVDKFQKVTLLNGGVPDSDGYVTFFVDEFHKGNLILAAYDADGVILWTWHIWLTDEPDLKASGQYVMMDRNLGATMAPDLSVSGSPFVDVKNQSLPTYGFYYQWGRKDPFPGPPSWAGSGSSSSVWWEKPYSSDGNAAWVKHENIMTEDAVSIPESVASPMVFYCSRYPAGETYSNWFDPSFDNGYDNVALWGYAVADYDKGESFTKTMYDPCPPGYTVAEYKVWNNDGAGYDHVHVSPEQELIYFGAGETAYNDGNFGYGLVTVKSGFEKNWYPMSGYRAPMTGDVSDAGSSGHFWTSTPMGAHNTRSLHFNTRYSGQYADSGQNGKGTAYGYPVRCMKE